MTPPDSAPGRWAVTGGDGFLGWHTRVLAHSLGWPEPVLVDRATMADPVALTAAVDGAERVLHLAGANRGEPTEVAAGNLLPARALADALRHCTNPPREVAFANSIQSGNDSPYGESKERASDELHAAAEATGVAFADVRLPNLFGEHGRPNYNSVVATFCGTLATGGTPEVHEDRKLDLLHATDAAAALLGIDPPATGSGGRTPAGGHTDAGPGLYRCTVAELAARLTAFAETYRTGEIPDLASAFDVRLFNTYRSHLFPAHYPLPLPARADARGELVEAVKVHGGGGQVFYSSTRPGVSRGDHYHLAKVERFVVLHGEAEIALRRVLHGGVVRFRVSGAEPVVVDMPTAWAHKITNVGDRELTTLFWANDLFDPDRPDTYPECVATTRRPDTYPEAVS